MRGRVRTPDSSGKPGEMTAPTKTTWMCRSRRTTQTRRAAKQTDRRRRAKIGAGTAGGR